MFSKKLAILVVLTMIATMVLAACGPTPEPETIIKEVPVEVTKIVEVEGESQTIIETVVEEVIVEVTAVPEEPDAPVVEEGVFAAPDPETYTYVTFGDIDTMDPNLCYDTASAALILNVMEGLIFFNREKMTEYVPVLAKEIPTVENGGISEDGMTYTFNIRDGVTFHNGNDMTPSDFEYTFERGLIQ
jgi:peptide/nickel transport system substrate-binding protein